MTLKEAKFCIGDFLDVSINSPNGRMDRWAGHAKATQYLALFTGLETDAEVSATGEALVVADLTTGEGMEGALVGPGVTEREVLELEETEREVSELEGIAKGALGLPGREGERGALGTGIDRIDPKKEQEWCECLFVSKVFVKKCPG